MTPIASSTSLYFNFLKGRDTASPHMNRVASNAQRMAASLRQQSRITGIAIAALVAIVLGAVGQIVAFTNAVWPMVGALAAIPAMAYAAAFGIATLLVGFKGLFAAMKRSTGGGGDLAAQEHRIATAQRAAAAAQDDLNEARRTAADLIADTTRALARARLDEEGAVLAVADAQRELREARLSGDRSAIRHASLGYRESIQSLEEVRARLAEVTEEEAKRRTAGVEGSTEVTDALQRQADAEYELAQARKGSGGADAAAQAYAKLTAAGRALVDVLREIGPAWGKVRQAVQAGMLAGLAGDIKVLSTAYLPVLRTHLVGIAVGWANAFRGTTQTFAAAGYVRDMSVSLGRVATMWQRVGMAFAPFWSGFRHLVVVGSEFLPRFGSWVLRLANRFDAWAKGARDTGKAHDWIEKALTAGRDFNRLLLALAGATGALFAAGDPGADYLGRLTRGAEAMRDFWRTPEGHDKLVGFFAQLRDIWSSAWVAFKQLLDLLSGLDLSGFVSVFTVLGVVFGYLADHLGLLNAILPVLIPVIYAYELGSFAVAVATRLWAVATAALKAVQLLWLGVMKAGRIAMMAWRGALWVTAGAQWALNTAMYANPIGLIILAIIALVAIILLLWFKCAWFRNFWIAVWHYILVAAKAVGHWFANDFVNFFVGAWHWITNAFTTAAQWVNDKMVWLVTMVLGIRQKIIDGAKGMWDGLVHAFKAAVNWMLRLWNDFHLTLGGGSILGVSIPSITLETPNLPYLAAGGTIGRGGAAVVADRNGRGGEVVSLPRGAQVTPLAGGVGGEMTIRIELAGPPEMRQLIRRIVRTDGGGNVQVAFGSG